MSKSKFYDKIVLAKEEREVEDVYNEGLTKYLCPNEEVITHPYKCDGLLEMRDLSLKESLKLIIEYKFDEDLHNAVGRAKVLIQVIFYMKQFEINGEKLPNIAMVGDKNEVFIIHTNPLQKYLDEKVNWNMAPSSAYEKYPDLLLKIANDSEIQPYVYDINEEFSFKNVTDKILEIATENIRKVRITEHNISIIFNDFIRRVLKKSQDIAPNDLVDVFVNSIIDRENCFQHPNNKNKLVCYGKNYEINGDYYKAFFSHFEEDYSPKDKNKFTEISDRLIEDSKRRRSGEFYTPTLFVDYAHKMLSEELGDDWKEKYVVWDCCWGTGNLTRDYSFKELYCSTLEQAELNCGTRYNPEATKFVFDFLNDDISNLFGSKLPPKLYEALEQNKPIVFFINPPYGTAGINNENSKEGIAKTKINKIMLNDNMGACSQNLYTQFLYRILLLKKQFNLTNLYIGVFCPTLFLTGSSYKNFRANFLSNFSMEDAIQFCASYFSNVADYWGISFSIWKTGMSDNFNMFNYKIVEENNNEICNESLTIVKNKCIYNLDNSESVKEWAKDKYAKNDTEIVCLKSAINPSNKIKKYCSKAIGVLVCDSNNIDKNMQYVCILNSNIPSNLGILYITENNFEKCMTICSARKLIFGDWINSKDEYLKPNENHPKFNEFVNDSIIFSLFHSGAGQASNQTSLKNIICDGKIFNIKNEFFFMSKNEIMNLANENHFDETYNDARVSDERFVYKKIKEISLSNEAKIVLDKAKELTIKSFKYRELFNQEHPEYQILNWDCGWYQIKALLKEYMKNDLEEFNHLYKILAEKMKPMVYELGFLK